MLHKCLVGGCECKHRLNALMQGRDDLRQDAVMQQVFQLVNKLLKKEPSTLKRKLGVRTYKVHTQCILMQGLPQPHSSLSRWLYPLPSHSPPPLLPFPQVIPLSQRSGVMEWCEGTMPIGEYLIGPAHHPSQGAHMRYRPCDWTSLDCRKKLVHAWVVMVWYSAWVVMVWYKSG